MSGAESVPAWLVDLARRRAFRLRLPAGAELGSDAPRFVVIVRHRALLDRLRRLPTPLLLARAWLDGDLDIDGDVFAAMEAVHDLEAAVPGPAMRLLGALRALWRPWRSASSDIATHYDQPDGFYQLFLDPRMVYTCAYYRDAAATLAEAQQAKLDLVCRKLRLQAGEHLLDLGCGWGPLSCWAATHYGVHACGVTLSASQACWARKEVARLGLADRVRIEHRDLRALRPERRYDKIAAIGVIEHVGRAGYARYFGLARNLLVDGGLLLNHGITMRAGAGWSSEMEFLDRYVFPGLDLVDVSTTLASMEGAGLEILDVENLRPHYARTTREWATALWSRRDEAVAIAGERTWRTFVAYLAAASVAFERGWIGLQQVLARPSGTRDAGRRPLLRDHLYSPR